MNDNKINWSAIGHQGKMLIRECPEVKNPTASF